MKLSIMSSVLLLGAAATPTSADEPFVFGRSMRKRSSGSSPTKRIRRYGEESAKKVSGPRRWSKTPKTPENSAPSADELVGTVAPKASKNPALAADELVGTVAHKLFKKSPLATDELVGTVKPKASKNPPLSADELVRTVKPKSSKHPALSADELVGTVAPKSLKKSALLDDESVDIVKRRRRSKTSKKTAMSADRLEESIALESMSYADFDSTFVGSMPDFDLMADRLEESIALESMSYADLDSTFVGSIPDFDHMPDFDPSISMPFSFDFSMPGVIEPPTTVAPPITTVAPPATTAPPGPMLDNAMGHIISEYIYMSICTDIYLDMDNCLVSKTIDSFMSMGAPNDEVDGRLLPTPNRRLQGLHGRLTMASNGRLRFLQASNKTEAQCGTPKISEQDLRPLMDFNMQQCADEDDVPDEDFERTLSTFLRIFAHEDCWESLCRETDPSELFFKAFFDQAAQCANVDLDIHKCAMDHIFELITVVDDGEQDSDPCNLPSEAELSSFVSFMMIDAKQVCNEMNITLESSEWNKATSDLVTIFTASQCWGIVDCDGEPDVSSIDYSWPTESPVYGDEKDSRLVVTDDGYTCIYEKDTDPELERTLVLSFFYLVGTVSADERSLEKSLENIERALIYLACSVGDGRRSRALNEYQQDTIVVAVDSSPEDVVSSDYTCSAESLKATSCYIIEGKVTLIVEGESIFDEIEMGAYSKVEEMFGFLPMVLGDSNVVDLKYIGTAAPSTSTSAEDAPADDVPADDSPADDSPDDTPSIDKLNNEDAKDDTPSINKLTNEDAEDDSQVYTTLLVGLSGGLVAMAMLISGFHRMNQKKEEEQNTMQPDEKSNDGQPPSFHTGDLTYATSCDRSDASSLSSPAHNL
mmetsp:Transcript_15742/g.28547  ORF Transcript_15742/g.28547 Transcript_15742/m.28547 type:complete len:875 (+) Transcript_15742:205-2829(+)